MDPGAGHAGRALRVNLIAVSVFGELEFWFALIKVVTIIALLVIGLVVILFGFGEAGPDGELLQPVDHGGLFPTGMLGVVLVLQIVMFAFLGVELVGVTAGEAEDPERCCRTRSTPWSGGS